MGTGKEHAVVMQSNIFTFLKAKPWVGRVGDSIDTAIGTLTGKLPMKRFGKQAVGDVPNCLHWAALLSASLKDEEENGQ